ncbi:hypothetical protein [Microbulbifer thermotolerans]|uniref:Lipoprotein n=1 Tax=Microbulbifer thermotolerans TaxID=252514 RepID=A0A143HR51_MICTH|nr:hypothetical protein [Microbulbifer thermotolerans]AMX03880.1 hypothetical protein A3224_15945 [Microbulbifer thermotolerans]MCX2778604.1 hypothetical protein [Microbulbifer thermotolerans]MCX2782850.1 hypothetical protein [Microbulbifer thermotolerans]MCX2794080.1 hypothetical protein [Microbulbifer thermotolerans]MCX2802975.1 hypothetical protein [Microbulbifer thermotolerans]
MMRITARALALVGLLIFSFSTSAAAQGGLLSFGGDSRNPSLTIAPSEIQIDMPLPPMDSADLALLLAQAGKGGGLASMKEAAVRKYRQYLEGELDSRLRAFFVGEEVPLVDKGGQLSLHSALDLAVIKHFNNLQSESGYDLERGTVELEGSVHYRVKDHSGRQLLEETLDIKRLKIREKYQVRTPKNGGAVEDTTEQAIKQALSRMAKELVDKMEDELEADELRDLLTE